VKKPGTATLVALVLSTVAIQLLVAALLKELAMSKATHAWVFAALAAAVALNALRFLVWGYTHRHYPLSRSYPLTALFFPCILLVSAWYGEQVGVAQVAGVGVIMLGLGLMNWGGNADG
jgi:drug/metabolite transporter (DMT)-like permease